MSPQLAEKLLSMKTDITMKLDEVTTKQYSTKKQKKFRRKIENESEMTRVNDPHEESSPSHSFARAASIHSKRIVRSVLGNNTLLIIILVLSSSCIKYVFCAIEPDKNGFDSDDDTFTKAVSIWEFILKRFDKN